MNLRSDSDIVMNPLLKPNGRRDRRSDFVFLVVLECFNYQ